MHLFFSKNISANHIVLPEDESLHAVKVLRLSENTEVGVIDGNGHLYVSRITKAHAKKCELTVVETKSFTQTKHRKIHIAIAPTKNSDRIEWFVEKAIEIGVDKITFLYCEHSERKSMNMDRTERVAMAALKQSQQYFQPVLVDMVKYSAFIESAKNEPNKYIAHLDANDRKIFAKEINDKEEVLILIGPEGDFSKVEIDKAKDASFVPVTLGPNRLRTETAGLYAVMACNIQS
jgi:16S rRNA (uracil1498-N3)-methyltransferase